MRYAQTFFSHFYCLFTILSATANLNSRISIFFGVFSPAAGLAQSLKMPTQHVEPVSHDLLQDVANALLKARKVVVVTGAGISTNSGIPVRQSARQMCFMSGGY